MNEELPKRRVVITGMGVIAPNGQDLDTFWRSIRDGASAAGPVTRFDVSAAPTKIAAEIRDFDFKQHSDLRKFHRLELSIQYALAAADQALRDAKLHLPEIDPDRAGIVEATSLSGTESALKGQTDYLDRGYRGVSPFSLINGYCGGGSGELALHLGFKGYAITISSGSASGSDALGYAAEMIRGDEVDLVVVGGAEAPLLPPLWGTFCVTKVMTRRNDSPAGSMRPYDCSRDGFLLGEGAAFLVLEELSHALQRGARIYAEVLGHGRSCEAFHSVAPNPEGLGLCRAIEKGLRKAGIDVSEVDYVNTHGTATEANDFAETLALKRVFKEHAFRVAVSSTKPVTGHLLAAAGAVESVVCALALEHQEIPPTINLRAPAHGCDLDYVPNRYRPYPLKVAMNVNVGFGGKNSCVILRSWMNHRP
jgi:3-oxoacyl-[acyl-carrier-protein] synthase II